MEFNCRFGDPETQAVLSLLTSPLGEVLKAAATGQLAELKPLEWKEGYAVTVVLAAEGYPASPRKGDAITSPDLEDPAKILHAGTATSPNGIVSNGGRVLNVLGQGATLEEARAQAYDVLGRIELEGSFFRTDIGARAAAGEISI